jgi:uncharacterized protein (TIGR02466 family)
MHNIYRVNIPMIEHWFATPVYYDYVQNIEQIQSDFNRAFNTLKSQNRFKGPDDWNTQLISDGAFTKNLITEFRLENFSTELDRHVRSYIAGLNWDPIEILNATYKITECWMTLTDKNHYSHVHTHKDADISGVYYYNTNKNDGDLVLVTQNKLTESSYCFKRLFSTARYQPEVGKIILFPGWLEHGTRTNITDNERVSVSFNITFNR